MDTEVLERSPAGNIVVLAGAAAPGREYDIAGRNAVDYYSRLSDRTVVAAPDPRLDVAGCLVELEGAAIIVLPGGSPRRLLDVLGGECGRAVLDTHSRGGTISGASAGAMVLCAHTMVPGQGLTSGLGLVPGVAIPHFDGSNWWDLDLAPDVPRWGLPECGGIFCLSGAVEATGAPGAQRLLNGQVTPVDRPDLPMTAW
jgi:putative intracellular protease/amidase